MKPSDSTCSSSSTVRMMGNLYQPLMIRLMDTYLDIDDFMITYLHDVLYTITITKSKVQSPGTPPTEGPLRPIFHP